MEAEALKTERRAASIAKANFYVLASISAWLCASSTLKLFEIQFLELIYALDGLLIVGWMLFHHDRVRLLRPLFRIAVSWFSFLILALALSLVALRSDFYIGENVSVLKQPFVVTLSRAGELLLDVGAMIVMASQFIEDRALCRFATRQVYFAGMTGCIFGLVSYVALKTTGGWLGGWGPDNRLVGFNTEGGPFGVYLVTVICATWVARSQGWLSRVGILISLPVMLLCIVLSASKAAMIELAAMIILISLLKLKIWKSLALISITAAVFFSLFSALHLNERIRPYVVAAQSYEVISNTRPKDGNYVVGRVAGVFLAPRMIAAHPWDGIGWGNYPIVRDDPRYRGRSPVIATSVDSPSLGLIDYIVEFGFPLFLLLVYVMVRPAVTTLRKGASTPLVALLLCLPISIAVGAHLNLTFPWIASSLALGIFYSRSQTVTVQTSTGT